MLCLCSSDGSADLGLSVLRGIQDRVPCGSDADPASSGPDPAGAEPAGRLRALQMHHHRSLRGGLPCFHAGTPVHFLFLEIQLPAEFT